VSKRGCSWILHYVKSAYAVTDVPDQVPELISQRRRWLNGSFFAAVHGTFHFAYIYRSSHTFLRKFWIHIEMLYQLFNLIFSWFALVRFHPTRLFDDVSLTCVNRVITTSRSTSLAWLLRTAPRFILLASKLSTSSCVTSIFVYSSCASYSLSETDLKDQSGRLRRL
jgi:cellulose synthase/poly-beta-1,6-N-acetylglucosamine synthase-like glycosyltransferase